MLLRFHCNQFLFDNGAEKTSPFHANALYAFAARANHACEPTIVFVSEAKILAKRGQDPSTGQGLVRAFAKRDLLPGEKLTPATRSIQDYLLYAREFDGKFPGFETDIHGLVEETDDNGKTRYFADCVRA